MPFDLPVSLLMLFETLPVVLAIVATVLCAIRYSAERRGRDRLVMALAVVCALLLIVGQLSWWVSYLLMHDNLGTYFANLIWTAFNCLMMTLLILLAAPRRKP